MKNVEHRRHRGAAARSADRPGAQQRRLRAVPGALHGLQPLRRRATARRRRDGGQSARAVARRGAASSATSPPTCPTADVSPFLQPTYNASIDFKQPAFLRRPRDAAAIGVFTHRSINPGVFIDHGYGGQVTFTHEVAIRAPVSLNYRYELNRVEASDVYFCVNYGVCDTLTISTLRSHQSLSPLDAHRLHRPIGPAVLADARATSRALDFEHASAFTLSDYRYNRVFFDAAVYGHKSRTKHVFSAHLRVGFVRALSSGDGQRRAASAQSASTPAARTRCAATPRTSSVRAFSRSTTRRSSRDATSIGGGTCALHARRRWSSAIRTRRSSRNADFIPQPLGGTSLLEGSVEYRFPLPGERPLGRPVHRRRVPRRRHRRTRGHRQRAADQQLSERDGAVTPGFGFAIRRRSARFASTSASTRTARRISRS